MSNMIYLTIPWVSFADWGWWVWVSIYFSSSFYRCTYLLVLTRLLSVDLEAHGGLYTLHAHLNHSCIPNVSIRHLDQRNALSRITVLANRPIKVGEELLVTYVNPKLGYKQRQDELSAWGFGKCCCERCLKEAKTVVNEDPQAAGMDDLAKELKAELGVMWIGLRGCTSEKALLIHNTVNCSWQRRWPRPPSILPDTIHTPH